MQNSLKKKKKRQASSSLDEISEEYKQTKFLEELNQFSPVKDLAYQVPVNGLGDGWIPLMPITAMYKNNTTILCISF